MALLLIILAVFAFLGFGSGSTGTSTQHATSQRAPRLPVTDCIEMAWEAGKTVYERPCRKAPAKP